MRCLACGAVIPGNYGIRGDMWSISHGLVVACIKCPEDEIEIEAEIEETTNETLAGKDDAR